MPFVELFGIAIRQADQPDLEHDNDNWELKHDWMTDAEMRQHIRRVREEMRRELIADFSLRNCPKHRHFWENLNGLEAFLRWHDTRERW